MVVIKGQDPIDYFTEQRLRMKKHEGWRRLRATMGGYFWGPCPICGMNTSGLEWSKAGCPSILTENASTRRGICVACADEGRDDPPGVIGTRDRDGNVTINFTFVEEV